MTTIIVIASLLCPFSLPEMDRAAIPHVDYIQEWLWNSHAVCDGDISEFRMPFIGARNSDSRKTNIATSQVRLGFAGLWDLSGAHSKESERVCRVKLFSLGKNMKEKGLAKYRIWRAPQTGGVLVSTVRRKVRLESEDDRWPR